MALDNMRYLPGADAQDMEPSNNPTGSGLYPVVDNSQDYFVEKDGLRYAGTHLLLELWGAKSLDAPAIIEKALCDAAKASKATILHVHLHHFSPSQGVSGVVVLAESHISIHTWPEHGYAAVDIFMCGSCNPYDAVPVIRDGLEAENIQVCEQKRGLIP